MSIKIDAAVAREDVVLYWARNRPARVLPDGHLGAVVNRRAMPVYGHRFEFLSVDVDDDGYDPSDCPFWSTEEPFRFMDDNVDCSDGPPLDWYLETNAYGHYVVFDGDETSLNNVLDALDRTDVGVRRHGTSYRPADNGHQYDWFIRLAFDGPREQAERLVTNALEGAPSVQIVAPSGAPTGTHGLISCLPRSLIQEAIAHGLTQRDPATLVGWMGRVAEEARSDLERERVRLQAEIDDAKAQAIAAQQMHAAATLAIAAERARHDRSINGLTSEVETLRRRLHKPNDSRLNSVELEAEVARLRGQLADQDLIYGEWQALETKGSSLKAELEEARRQVKALAQENQSLESRVSTRTRSNDRMLSFVIAALKAFSSLDIHGDAADTILDGFSNPSTLFDILTQLNSGSTLPAHKIATTRDWFEVAKHISTGRSDMGRVYYRVQPSRRLFVVIHHKRDDLEQSRFFAKLCDPSFSSDLSFDQR